ncbi:hypothetical protein PPL_07959 [Heterostelium album PN500]|uniref:Uncharacterized protein n=1 Tax=Heterostelium pallidum (strain ATCC 26659 / Pp 5 / PN500) TaxID=670386 RepID=D3BHF7_HETP5|nr:hypothetical protein PPL_07959 [Heterostelium album PN500]EFA79134.1 hypothetical protein PPL_07959 [Heterostelium album PN500]|eukprot:XP_020431256.1 hypothetical protein PPL_07959 [Heterostelium album PN500]
MIPAHFNNFTNQQTGNISNSSSPLSTPPVFVSAATTATAGSNTTSASTLATKQLSGSELIPNHSQYHPLPYFSGSLPNLYLNDTSLLYSHLHPLPSLHSSHPHDTAIGSGIRMEMIQQAPQWSGVPKIMATHHQQQAATHQQQLQQHQQQQQQIHHIPPEMMDPHHPYFIHHQQQAAAAAAASLQTPGSIPTYSLPPQTTTNPNFSPYQYPANVSYWLPPGATHLNLQQQQQQQQQHHQAQQHHQQQQMHRQQPFSLQAHSAAAYASTPPPQPTTATPTAQPLYRIPPNQHQINKTEPAAFVDEASASLSPATDEENDGKTHMQKIVSQFYKTLFHYHPNTTIISQDLPLPPSSYAPFSIVYTPNIPSKFLPPSSANTSSSSSPAEAFDTTSSSSTSTPKTSSETSKKKNGESSSKKDSSKKEKERDKEKKQKKKTSPTTNSMSSSGSAIISNIASTPTTTTISNNDILHSNSALTPKSRSEMTTTTTTTTTKSVDSSPNSSIHSEAATSIHKESSPPSLLPIVVPLSSFAAPHSKLPPTAEETTNQTNSNSNNNSHKEYLSSYSNLPSIQIKPTQEQYSQNVSIPFIQPPPNIKVPEYTITPIIDSVDDKQNKSGLGSFDYFDPWVDRKNSNPYSMMYFSEPRKNSIGGMYGQERKNSFLFTADRKNSGSLLSGIDIGPPLVDNSLPLLHPYYSNSRRSSMEIKPLAAVLPTDLVDLNFIGRKRSLSQDDIHFDDPPNTKLKLESSVAT